MRDLCFTPPTTPINELIRTHPNSLVCWKEIKGPSDQLLSEPLSHERQQTTGGGDQPPQERGRVLRIYLEFLSNLVSIFANFDSTLQYLYSTTLTKTPFS